MSGDRPDVIANDRPTITQLRAQMTGCSAIFQINGFLRKIGLGSAKLADLATKFQQQQKEFQKLAEYPKLFNKYFSDDGWIAHDSMNCDILKRAVEEFEAYGRERACAILADHYRAEQVAIRSFMLYHVEELRVRRKYIEFALSDDKEGRFYSAVPLLLMMIDGAMNDAVGKGFHAENVDLDVWDSLLVEDGAIYTIRNIFKKGRNKTRIEPIDMPYRNGILHGMDLGYDNPTVAAKCWCYLFVVRDWILSKKSEPERKAAFKKESRIPSLRELASQLAETDRLRKAIESWVPRQITPDFIASLNLCQSSSDGTPECLVFNYLSLWSKRNYGRMAALFSESLSGDSKSHVRDVRSQCERLDATQYSIKQIRDTAPAISEVDVTIGAAGVAGASDWTFRLIREDTNGAPLASNIAGGIWKIDWLRQNHSSPIEST